MKPGAWNELRFGPPIKHLNLRQTPGRSPSIARAINPWMVLIFASISLVVGLGSYHLRVEQGRRRLAETLRTITSLKAQEVASWRRERKGDILTLGEALLLPRSASALLSDQSATNAAQRLAGYLDQFRLRYQYRSAILFGADQRVVVASPAELDPEKEADPVLRASMYNLERPQEGGVRRMDDGTFTVGFLAPVGGTRTNRFAGAVLLVADLDTSVISMLDTAGMPLRAEAFLVSGDPARPVYLNRRWRRAAPASIEEDQRRRTALARLLSTNPQESGFVEGEDDRGVRSTGAIQKVPDSDWLLLYKADSSELVSLAITASVRVAASVFILLSLISAALRLRSQGRELRLVALQMSSERAAAEALRRLGMILQHAKDVILLVDEDMRIVEANGSTADLYGCQPMDLVGLSVLELRAPEARPSTGADFEAAAASRGITLETKHVRRNGVVFPVEVSCTPLRIEGRVHLLSVVRDISIRKEAEERLAQRNQLLTAVFSQAVDSIVVFEVASGRFIEFNLAAYQTLGYTREEFAGLGLADLQPDVGAEKLAAAISGVCPNESTAIETLLRGKAGNPRTVHARLRRLSINGLDCIAATWTDITERKRAEERAFVEKQRTELLLELHKRAPSMTDLELYEFVLDLAAKFTDSTVSFFHRVSEEESEVVVTGWCKSTLEISAVAFGTRLQPAEAESWIECVRQQRTVVHNEFNDFIHPHSQEAAPSPRDHATRYMGTPVIEEGSVRCLLGVSNKLQPFTAVDAGHLELLASELQKLLAGRATEVRLRQLSHAVEQSPATIVITDTSGAIVYANCKFVETTGYTLEESLGRNPRILKSGQMPEAGYRQLWDTILRGETWRGELCNKRKNGELYWEFGSISAIKDAAGRTTHFIAVKEDITHRRKLEEELRQSQKLDAIGQLAGGIAHDFNNILAAMMLQLSLLQTDSSKDPETLLAVTDLMAEARRASSLVRQLLMFSRRSVLKMQPLRLHEIVDGLIKMLRRLIGEHIELSFESPPNLPAVEADAGMLEQVLMNLVVNARDAIDKSGQIKISLMRVEFDEATSAEIPSRRVGEFVCLSVSDTGCGMDPSTQGHIFEPFFTTKPQGKGTGLGLATVHGIVAQHRGWIEVLSRLGCGTIFKVYLPTMKLSEAQKEQTPAQRSIPKGTERILLVEDEELLRRQVRAVLTALGYHVYVAGAASEALDVWHAQSGAFDLLLTDMVMPGGTSGLELAEQLSAFKPSLKVVVSTGYSTEIALLDVEANLRINLLPKPYELDQLARVVRSALDRET